MTPILILTIAWAMYAVFLIILLLDTRKNTKSEINFKIASIVIFMFISAGYGALVLYNLSK